MRRPQSGRIVAAILGVWLGVSGPEGRSPAQEAGRGGEASDVRSILRRAVRAAEEIEEAPLRSHSLVPIAEAQALAGDRRAARGTLEKAITIVDASPDLDPVARSAELATVARSLSEIGSRGPALEVLRRAVTLAESSKPAGEEDGGLRCGTLARCAAVQAAAGDHAAARETFRRAAAAAEAIKDRENRFVTLLECERAALGAQERAVARGVLDGAVRAARAFEDADRRSLALEEISARLAETGDFDEALRFLAETPKEHASFAPGTIAQFLGALKGCDRETVGRVQMKVRLIVDDLEGPRDQAEALGEVALALAELGEVDEARAIADDLGVRAVDRMRGGNRFGRSQIRWQRAEVLAAIALARAGNGDRKELEETVQEVLGLGLSPATMVRRRESALERIALARAKAGDYQGARDLAKVLKEDAARIGVLMATADAQARAGDGDGAVATLRQAFEATAEHAKNAEPDRKAALEKKYPEIALAQAKAGDYAGAIRTSAAMDEEFPEVIEAIARAWAKAGDANVAASWASGREAAPARAAGLLGVAEEVIAGRRVLRGRAPQRVAGPNP